MKSRQWDKLTTDRYVEFCNNWCCPCNDGSTGCFANEHYQVLCENTLFKETKFSKLLDESYDCMISGKDEYEEFCERFVKELEQGENEMLDIEKLTQAILFGIEATNGKDSYSVGMRNGMRWVLSMITNEEPIYDLVELEKPKEEDNLNFRAYDILAEHIFEYKTKLDNAETDNEKHFIKKRIEVYEYLLKLIDGGARE